MAWYRTGTIDVTAGSPTVSGNGTTFFDNVQQGDAVYLPDGTLGEVSAVVSNTELTLAEPYAGLTAAAQNYRVIPTRGRLKELADHSAALIADFEDIPAEVEELRGKGDGLADRAALSALSPYAGRAEFLKGPRGGRFVWTEGDYSTRVATDATGGLVVAATGVPAAQGAWVRAYGSRFDASWFVQPGMTPSETVAGLNACFALAKSLNIRNVDLPGGDLVLNGSVFVPYGIKVHGSRSMGNATRPATRIIPVAGASYVNGFMFLFNTPDAVTISEHGNYHGGGMEYVLFDNGGVRTAGVKGLVAAGHNYVFRSIGSNNMLQSIVRAPGWYSDNFRLEQCFHAESQDPEVYQVEIAGHGDCVIIDGYNARNIVHKSIWIRGDNPSVHYTNQASLRGVINGIIRNDCMDVEIEGMHNETSYIIYTQGSSTVIRNSLIYQSADYSTPNIRYMAIGFNENQKPARLTLDNVTFVRFGRSQHGAVGGIVTVDGMQAFEVTMPQQGILTLREVRRALGGANCPFQQSAIRVGKDDEVTPVPNFADYSEHLCQNGRVGINWAIKYGFGGVAWNGTDVYLGGATVATNTGKAGAWSGALGTYRYQIVRMLDPVGGSVAIGVTNRAEVSLNIDADTKVASLCVYNPSAVPTGVYRIYRASPACPAGQYDAVAVVGAMGGTTPFFVDEGDTVGGVAWTVRAAAAVDPYTVIEANTPFVIEGPGKIRTTVPVFKTVGDANLSITRWATETVVVCRTPLTGNRNLYRGVTKSNSTLRLVRTSESTGAYTFTLNGAAGAAPALPAPTVCAFAQIGYHDGVGAWVVTEAGQL